MKAARYARTGPDKAFTSAAIGFNFSASVTNSYKQVKININKTIRITNKTQYFTRYNYYLLLSLTFTPSLFLPLFLSRVDYIKY